MTDSASLREKLIERQPSSYDRFLTSVCRRRRPVIMRAMHGLTQTLPEPPLNLSGGLPSPQTFPFQEATFVLKEGGDKVQISPEAMKHALQYQSGPGYAPLMKQLAKLLEEYHHPPNWQDKDTIMLSGGTEGIGQTFEMLIEEGDGVILPEYAYAAALSNLLPLLPNVISVPSDKDGMLADELERKLTQYNGKKIKFLFVTPTGGNPTGVTFSLERMEKIYKLACKYDFLIVEDDPYFFLRLDVEKNPISDKPSFLSLDTETRVIRLDSFSKVLGPGLRLGWITGPKPVIKTMLFHVHCSTNSPNLLSQVLVNETLKQWGKEGFDKHILKIQSFYRSQRDAILAAATKHLTGLVEWDVPIAGMFVWMKLLKEPDAQELILTELIGAGLLITPGSAFTPDPLEPSPYFRVSFSLMTPDHFDKGFAILAKVLKSVEKKRGSA